MVIMLVASRIGNGPMTECDIWIRVGCQRSMRITGMFSGSSDLLGLCGCHFGLECGGCRGFFGSRNGSSPREPRVWRSTLAAQRAFHANRFSGMIHVCTHTVAAIQTSATSQDFPRRTGEAVPLCIIRKRTGQEAGAAALRIALG